MEDTKQSRHFVYRSVWVHDSCGRTLGSVHRRAAADGEEAVAAGLEVQFLNFVYHGDGRIGRYLGIMLVCNTCLVKRGLCNRRNGLADRAAGDDHDLFDVIFLKQLGSLAQCTLSLNGDGLAPVETASGYVENRLK